MNLRGRPVSALALLALCASARLAPGAGPLDVLMISETTVYRWNTSDPGRIFTTQTGTSLFGELTRMNDGRILAYRTTYGGQTPALYQVDPQTGATTLLIQSAAGAPHIAALAPTTVGDLLGCDNDLGFVRINPNTLSYRAVTISAAGKALSVHSGAMAASPTGDIYAWASGFDSGGGGVFSKLFRINPTTSTAVEIGGYTNLPASQSFEALAFSGDGLLYGFTTVNGGVNGGPFKPNGIYQLDLQTGIPTLLTQRSELANIRGAVLLPEPGTLTLLAAFATFALLSRQRPHRNLIP
jgi:hypothetical protein